MLIAAWLPVALWMVALIALSVVPVRAPEIEVPFGLDKWLHGGFYAVLGWFVARAGRRSGASPEAAWALAVILSTLYGASLEWLQGRVGRDPSVTDAVADALGAAIGASALILLKGRARGQETG